MKPAPFIRNILGCIARRSVFLTLARIFPEQASKWVSYAKGEHKAIRLNTGLSQCSAINATVARKANATRKTSTLLTSTAAHSRKFEETFLKDYR